MTLTLPPHDYSYRTNLVDKYEKYANSYLLINGGKFKKCGTPVIADGVDDYAFYFPLGTKKEFYVDQYNSLSYFIVKSNGIITRQWSANVLGIPKNTKKITTNNFLILKINPAYSLGNQCGSLPTDHRPIDAFYFGHSYAHFDKNAKLVCKKDLANHFDKPLREVVKENIVCSGNSKK